VNDTSIEWTNFTANPLKLELPDGKRVNVCLKISEGCRNCYAESIGRRWWGKGRSKYPGYSLPLQQMGRAVLVERELDDVLKLSAKIAAGKSDPANNKIFWNDVTDEYLDFWPDEFLDRIWAVRALTPNLIHQVLTKRPGRMAEYLNLRSPGIGAKGHACKEAIVAAIVLWHESQALTKFPLSNQLAVHPLRAAQDVREWKTWPLPNVWLGISVENQDVARDRITNLLKCPSAIRFLSVEPLISRVDLDMIYEIPEWVSPFARGDSAVGMISWVIVGGESGPGARACNLDWIRRIVRRCKDAGVACFVKQLGARIAVPNDSGKEWPRGGDEWTHLDDGPSYQGEPIDIRLDDSKGGDPSEWPEDLRVREFPNVEAIA